MTGEIITTTPDSEIVTTRIFNYAQTMLFRAWSDPAYLKQWWGPKGFTNTFHAFDFREGGTWKFIMHGPDKGNYANECEFIKIVEPSLIAWKRHSKPLFQVCTTFEALSTYKTICTFKMLCTTVEECQKLKPYVVDKNEENFDRLEKVLEKMNLK